MCKDNVALQDQCKHYFWNLHWKRVGHPLINEHYYLGGNITPINIANMFLCIIYYCILWVMMMHGCCNGFVIEYTISGITTFNTTFNTTGVLGFFSGIVFWWKLFLINCTKQVLLHDLLVNIVTNYNDWEIAQSF